MTPRRQVLLGLAVAAAGVLWWRLRPDAPSSGDEPDDVVEPRVVGWLASWTPAAPRTPAGRVAAYVWAAPLTAAGMLLGSLSGTAPQVRDGVLLFTDVGGVAGAMLQWRGFSAATLGHVIVAAGRPDAALLRHELVHVRQAERWGPLFVPLYLAALLRYGYRRNPFERAAYTEQRRPPFNLA